MTRLDGRRSYDGLVPLLPAQDHKRVGEGDTGPNTGGMGAYTPLPWLPEDGVQRIVDEVVAPVARQMVEDGCPFSGLLYAGLAWGAEGLSVVEFNCRFGDPETQAVLALLRSPVGAHSSFPRLRVECIAHDITHHDEAQHGQRKRNRRIEQDHGLGA